MSPISVAVIYYSSTGNHYRMALAAREAAEATGAEVRLRRVRELAPEEAIDANPLWRQNVEATQDIPIAEVDDLDWADVFIFGTPTRFGNVTSQMKQFMDQAGPLWAEGKLANKVGVGFTGAQNPHGGQESTLLTLYNVLIHWGCILVPPGYTSDEVFAAGGNPYGVSVTAPPGQSEPDEAVLEAVKYMTQRAIQVATWIKKGQAEA